MNELIKLWFNSGLVNYLLVMLTILILTMMIFSAIRVILEISIPKAYKECIGYYFIVKNASYFARKKIIKDNVTNDKQL